MRILFFAPLLVATSLFSVTIKSVEFQGLVRMSDKFAGELTALKVGQDITAELANTAIKKLYQQKYFTDIYIEENNGAITVHVKEKPAVAKVDLEGIGTNDKDVLLPALGLNVGMMYDEASVNEAKTRIKQFFEMKGFLDTVVEVKTEELDSPDVLKVIFEINRGEKVVIHEVKLSGTQNVKYSDVEPTIANKSKELLGWFWGFNSGELKTFELPMESDRIKDVYLQKGYLDAQVSNPFLRTFTDSFNARVSYNIEEGSVYRVNSISFVVDDGLIDEAKVLDDLALEVGDVANITKLRQDIEKIEKVVANQGYAFVRVTPDLRQDHDAKSVDIVYTIVQGEKVNVRQVRITGNSKTIDRVVRRELYLTEGQLYNRDDLIDSRNAIRRTGYFEEAEITEVRVNRTQVDLLVTVKEAPTGAISGGIGFGSSDGLILSGSVSEGNIFGSGIRASVDIERSDNELQGRISLSNPRVRDSVYSLGGSIYAQDNDWLDYEEEIQGFEINGGRRFGRYVSVNLAYILDQIRLSGLEKYPDSIYRDQEGRKLKSAVVPSITFNNTDDYYLPRRGFEASASFEYAGVGGDHKYIRTNYRFATYLGLEDMIDYDLILRYRARVAMAWDRGFMPINEKLYLGGLGSIRGYRSRSIGPKDSGGRLIGGDRSFVNSFEASFPLVKRFNMRGAFFFDYGMVGDGSFNQNKRAGTGVSLEWISPMGPIALIFAKPLMKKAGDETSSFEFSMGRQF